jgi:hypothetical protein
MRPGEPGELLGHVPRVALVGDHGGPGPGDAQSRAIERLAEQGAPAEQPGELLRAHVPGDVLGQRLEADSFTAGEYHRPQRRGASITRPRIRDDPRRLIVKLHAQCRTPVAHGRSSVHSGPASLDGADTRRASSAAGQRPSVCVCWQTRVLRTARLAGGRAARRRRPTGGVRWDLAPEEPIRR